MSNAEAKRYYETARCDACGLLQPTEYLHTAGGCSTCKPKRLVVTPDTEGGR